MRDLVGKIVRHFKGNMYLVLHEGLDVTTGERVVIYRALYGERLIWVRKYDEFMSEVPEGREDNKPNQKYRFEEYKSDNVNKYIKLW